MQSNQQATTPSFMPQAPAKVSTNFDINNQEKKDANFDPFNLLS